MDPIWLLVILIIVVVFATISITGALWKIRDSNNRIVDLLERETPVPHRFQKGH